MKLENRLYKLNSSDQEYYNQHPYSGYIYAKPVDYAVGHYIGDCWIVNKDGEIHPGYNCSPVPFNINSLIPA
jgi:hypothetical protein